jgi:hypothetical protein
MRKFQPEGSEADTLPWSEGRPLTVEQTKAIRQKLRKNPNDLTSRLLLFDRGFREHSGSWIEPLMWLIDNHPKSIVHQYVTPYKNDERYEKARQSWLSQIRSNLDDVTVLCNAASFFQSLAPEDSVKFLKRAIKLDPLDDELPMRLSQQYRLMTGHFSARKNKTLAHKAVEQMKVAIERFAQPTNEDSYLLPYFGMELKSTADLALAYDLLLDASDLARLLLNHKSISSQRLSSDSLGNKSIFDLSINRGHAILGRVALASGNIQLAKEHLMQMTGLEFNMFHDTQLADELLQLGETDTVSAYLEYLLSMWEQLLLFNASGKRTGGVDENHVRNVITCLKRQLKAISKRSPSFRDQ